MINSWGKNKNNADQTKRSTKTFIYLIFFSEFEHHTATNPYIRLLVIHHLSKLSTKFAFVSLAQKCLAIRNKASRAIPDQSFTSAQIQTPAWKSSSLSGSNLPERNRWCKNLSGFATCLSHFLTLRKVEVRDHRAATAARARSTTPASTSSSPIRPCSSRSDPRSPNRPKYLSPFTLARTALRQIFSKLWLLSSNSSNNIFTSDSLRVTSPAMQI